uniref:ATP synthase complex subunit 8 n=1 Tax=Promalactis suzukiella TaxID=1511820 RepID=A0A0U1Z1X1_9NEOP|nr:ATP synthase F0 subunit 8 [Promalactis suzukiella]AJO68667.1 ATP synthase F0 subunit 8 [Promalactis suzukiella]
MPQMMPINWMISLFLFISIFILFNILNYYIYNPSKTNLNFKLIKSINNYNWKW